MLKLQFGKANLPISEKLSQKVDRLLVVHLSVDIELPHFSAHLYVNGAHGTLRAKRELFISWLDVFKKKN